MNKIWFMLPLALITSMQIAEAGSHWVDTVAIVGSEPNIVGDYRIDFTQYSNFERERDLVKGRWMAQCEEHLVPGVTLDVISSDFVSVADGQSDFEQNYWIVSFVGDLEAGKLLGAARNCSNDAYLRTIVFSEPTRHPICSWACRSDPDMYIAVCATNDFLILLPEKSENPFRSCGIGNAEYLNWLETNYPNWQH